LAHKTEAAREAKESGEVDGRVATTNILFVCIGNACRSPMAEGFASKLGEGRVRAWSAGLCPLGWIESNTRLVMEEIGIRLDGQASKGLGDVPFDQMDIVVTMGSEVLIDLPEVGGSRLVNWEIPDPVGADLDTYRVVRDLIEVKVRNLLADLARE
jgi:arsenate reductase (thioredoxin)